ncbi:uncharacterized protein fgl2b [Xyrauchen texanus]|uniref:uncharacterized protein fgl2b n=1 Tax=Xyrauchen texanus TaxID=154827 RepID=UPI0022429776|nr:uncharacterized protein fgl2b [Xyrauchen texanus]
MWIAVMYFWGALLAYSACDSCPESEDTASWVKLKPLEHCRDEETFCPYQITLPPLSIQLPRPFKELEKMAKELQNLKEAVNQLRRDCQECKHKKSAERCGQKDQSEQGEAMRAQSPRHNVTIMDRQSDIPSGEQVVQIVTSTLGDTLSERNIRVGMKRLDPAILERQGWTIDRRTDVDQGTTDQRSEMSREVKILNPSLSGTPEDIYKAKEVASPTTDQLGESIEPSLPRNQDDIQPITHGKQQLNILKDGNVKNISGILSVRRREQNVLYKNGLSSISGNANTKTMDLGPSSENKRVINFPGVGGELRPKTYVNSRGAKLRNEDRLKNPTVLRKPNPQAGDRTVKIGSRRTRLSSVGTAIMQVKETNPYIADTNPGTSSGLTPSTDNQKIENKQDASRVLTSTIDYRQGLKDASQVTIVEVESSRKLNKSEIATKLRKVYQGDMNQKTTNKSISSVMDRDEQPNMVKEENEHVGFNVSLVITSNEAKNSTKASRADSSSPQRQVDNERFLNPIKETETVQREQNILDRVNSSLNAMEGNPLASDLKDQRLSGTFTDVEHSEAAKEEIAFNSLSARTVKKEILSNAKATLEGTDLVSPTLTPTVKSSKSTDVPVSTANKTESLVVGQISKITSTPSSIFSPKAKSGEDGLNIATLNSKRTISKIQEPSQNKMRSVKNITQRMPKLPKRPDRHPTSLIPFREPKQPNVLTKVSVNGSVLLRPKLPFSGRGRNGTGLIKPIYIRKRPTFQTVPTTNNPNRGLKTKESMTPKFIRPIGATSTKEQNQNQETKDTIQVRGANVLENHRLAITNIESKSLPGSETQHESDILDLDTFKHSNTRVGEHSRDKQMISNMVNGTENQNKEDLKYTLHSGDTNSATGEEENKQFSLGTADTKGETPFGVDKISSGRKMSTPQHLEPTTPTLMKGISGVNATPFMTSNDATVSITDTDHEERTKNIPKLTNTLVEIFKNISQKTALTPISFENTGATSELELIKLNEDRVKDHSGEILSNPNSVHNVQGNNGEKDTIPVVLERLTNVEEIKRAKLFSLSPEDTAEGFKSNAISDEVTERDQEVNKLHSTCRGDCDTTPTERPKTHNGPPFDSERDKRPAQDCADYITKTRKNGIYRVMPRSKNSPFHVFCDMGSSNGGWTLIQRRFDGSTSFNRSWDEYKRGFGKLMGEFWLGNDKIHWLTKAKNMSLRIELEDFKGNKEYALYKHFYVANESQQYRMSIDGYSGTAGNAMQLSKKYNHNQKLFSTPDRDNDQYPSGNCGAYYSSGWWFDACMSANLNGNYYNTKYKGVRNGIFWGTWHNITMEYYPTNYRNSFKTVRMMVRPKNYVN